MHSDIYENYDNEYADEYDDNDCSDADDFNGSARTGYDDEYDYNINEDNADDCDLMDDVEFVSTVPVPTYDEKNRLDYVALMKDYHSGDDHLRDKAVEIIVGDLTGLVLYIIKKKYSNYTKKYYDDLVQSGEMGILIGLKDYDPKFAPSTYFYYPIIHEIQEFINGTVYKTTPYYSVNIKKVNRAIAAFENAGLSYTKRDISIQTGIPLDTVEKVMSIMNGKSEMSIEAHGQFIEDSPSSNPAEEYIKKESLESIYKILRGTLTQEEIIVISHLYGLGELEQLSLKAIAKKMGISIDKIKKLKISAFCKLKNSPLTQFRASNYRNDLLELEDADSISLFPQMQAINSAKEMKEIEIDF